MLVSLVLLLSVSTANATEPTATLATPAMVTAPADTTRVNRPGLRNKAPIVVTYGPDGCPLGYTVDAQYMTAAEYAVVMGAGSDARKECLIAKARASAIEDHDEAERLRAEGDRGATLLLASAGADVARGASGQGQAVYLNVNNGVVATGNAAPLAAVDGSLGATGLSPWVIQGAMDVSALQALNGGVIAPPVTAPVTSPPPSATTPKPAPKLATVSEAESRILGVE